VHASTRGSASGAELLKWSFLSWIGRVAAITALLGSCCAVCHAEHHRAGNAGPDGSGHTDGYRRNARRRPEPYRYMRKCSSKANASAIPSRSISANDVHSVTLKS
jgi:hypothetical protein